MKKYTTFDEIIDHKGNFIKIEESFNSVNGSNGSNGGSPCYDVAAGNDPTCDCNPRIGHTFKITACKINGIWFQNPNTWAPAPTDPGPFSTSPSPCGAFHWADWGPMLFSDFNNSLNPPNPWWNTANTAFPYHDFVWNTHATNHHLYGGGSQVSNPWEDAFYQNVVNSLGSGVLTVGQKFSAQISPHPNGPGYPPGIAISWATGIGLVDGSDLVAAGVDMSQDLITDFCFEYAGYQLAWQRWVGYWDSFSVSNCGGGGGDEFHNWIKCAEQPAGMEWWASIQTTPFVWLDESNFYGLTENPGGYNTSAIAAASTVLYNGWGAPNVGDIVKLGTTHPTTGEYLNVCLEYLGSTATQQNPQLEWDASTNTQYIQTFADCITCAFGELDQGDDDKIPCYSIGDITDPADGLGGAGGMVFALPNIPPNHTPYYYEVALDDLSVGTTPVDSLIIDNVFPFTQTAFPDGQRECGHGVAAQPQAQLCFPISSADPILYPIDTTIGNMQARYPFGAGGPIDSCNPSGANISSIIMSAPVTGVDFNGNPVWSSGTSPMLLSIEFIPANSATVPTTGQVVMSLPYDSYLFEFDTPMNNLTSALYLKQLDILGGIPITQPFSTIGAEWGAYNDQLTLPTSVDFGEGLNNTSNILAQPALPVWPTHDIAANLCSTYNPPSSAPNRWFLPSLMEFHAIYTNVGPGTPHAAALNLSAQLEDLQDTYWTSSSLTGFIPDPTSSATTPPLIGGPSGTFSDPFAWAYNTHDPIVPYPTTISQNLPIGPNVITRCSTLSVRPVRRFECVGLEDPIDLSCDDTNPCDDVCDGFFAIGNPWGSSLNDLYFFGDVSDYDSNNGVLVATQAQLQTDINNSGDLEPGYTIWDVTEISRFSNRLWMKVVSFDFSQGASFNVDYGEWIVDTWGGTPTIIFNRLIKTDPGDYVGWQSAGGSGLYDCTFLIARRYVGGGSNWDQYDICTVDVSGPTAVITSLFPVPIQSTDPGSGVRDITHVCDIPKVTPDTYVYTHRPLGSPTDMITHVDLSGTILGSVPIGTGDVVDVAFGVCCFNGEVFVSRNYNNTNEIYSVNLNTYTLGSTIFSGIYIGDLASNPICCPGCCDTEGPSGDDCEYVPGDIGPAGGIIVAVPYMNINDPSNGVVGPIINPLQGQQMIKNPTKYYYEISPTNLNSTSIIDANWNCSPTTFDSAQWGFANSPFNDIASNPAWLAASGYWTPENNYYSYTGTFFTNEFMGEGSQATADILSIGNYGGFCNPPNPYVQLSCGGTSYSLTPKWVFEMCGDYELNGYDDWFLPTTREMQWVRNYTPPGTLYDSTNGMAVVNSYGPSPDYEPYFHYWTCNTDDDEGNFSMNLSGQTYNPLSLTDGESAFTVSMGPIDTLNASPDGENWRTKTHRCHNNNVRAMRRFECDPDPCLPDNFGATDCSCVEYNYRDGAFVVAANACGPGDYAYGSLVGHSLFNSFTTDNVIGDSWLQLIIASRDVMGNNWTYQDWADDSIGYTISVWDNWYNFIGKWHYSTYSLMDPYGVFSNTVMTQDTCGHYANENNIVPKLNLYLTGVTHLQAGPGYGPVANVGDSIPLYTPGASFSTTNCYLKIEAACTQGVAFETACNYGIWGDSEYEMPFSGEEWPHVCSPSYMNPPTNNPYGCIPTWGTHPHYDISGNSLSVYETATDCVNACGAVSIASPTSAKLASLDNISESIHYEIRLDIDDYTTVPEGADIEAFEKNKKILSKEQNELKEEKGNGRTIY